jgi:DNA-binding Lrp family transcriptional regulator
MLAIAIKLKISEQDLIDRIKEADRNVLFRIHPTS